MDDIKVIRDKAIERMQATLESVEPVDMPYWVMMAIMFPVFMYEALSMTIQMVWTLIRCSFHFVGVGGHAHDSVVVLEADCGKVVEMNESMRVILILVVAITWLFTSSGWHIFKMMLTG